MTGFIPKNIEDLYDIFNNLSRLVDRMKYENYIQDKLLSPEQELEIKNIFSKLGKCEKIPEDDNKKTFDFKLEELKLLVEVTTINPSLGESTIIDDRNIISTKVRKAMKHITDKDASEFNGYFCGGVIYCSSLLLSLTTLWEVVQNSYIKKKIISSGLDYLIFLPQNASIAQSDSRTIFQPLVFIKNKSLTSKFQEGLPHNYKIMEI